ncbi:MAG: 50S ribosomal protein L29 [Bifidobacteriaceae bacterium]|jgi:large subunit ribosomal protein L29|nr:50S ribosomal protein L29 [Bifidobacteriaceae bacterium]
MAVGSKDLLPDQLDLLDDERLRAALVRCKEELFNLRFATATGQSESHGRLKAVKRDIARVYTVLREREMGIRTAPSSNVEAEKK